ncbi:MAG: MgtC/SapB family protein [Betaproteobacteria bacterium]
MTDLYRMVPPEGIQILLVLFLAFLLGLEREEHKAAGAEYAFGGVRTFPLIGLIGYAIALLAGDQFLPVAVGLAVVAAFLLVSYSHKLQSSGTAGVTSEISALATYLVGALVARDRFWTATTLSVAGLFLLELKAALEGLTKRIAPDEILTFTKFLLLTAVILPVLPDRAYGPIPINPLRAWLVVVAVSAVSYGSYVIQRVTKGQGGIALSAVLGGAYSSTVTTVVLARRAAREARPHLLSGSTLMASGMMYLRLAALVGLFNHRLLALLGVPFAILAVLALGIGWLWSRLPDGRSGDVSRELVPRNPLELGAALLFGALFLAMLVATRVVVMYLGRGGLYSLAAVMGVTDVDPFIMGLTQAAGSATAVSAAAVAIVTAASSNNLFKGIYAYAASDRRTGRMSLALLVALGIAGLAPIAWLWHG